MARPLRALLVIGSAALLVTLASGVLAEPISHPSDVWVRAVAGAPWEGSEPEALEPEAGPQVGSEPRDEGLPPTSSSARTRPSGTAFSEMVENIIVTTRKRRESIQQIPVPISALSQQSLKQLSVRRIQDIAPFVPNLDYAPTIGLGNAARINIRGVGQSDPIGSLDSGVGLFVDGVYLPRLQSGLLHTADVERVEVVRGPQGTIFGKNTIGGAVRVITRLPQFELGGSLEVRAGNFDLFETRGVLNVPLAKEAAALRLSLATATRDGFSKDRLGGSDPNDEKLLAGRAQLLLLPAPNFEVRLSGDYSRENKIPDQGKCVVRNSGANPGIRLINSAVGFTQACASIQANRNPRRVETDLTFLRDEMTTYGGSAQLIWSLGPNLELRSLASVRGLDRESFSDFDGTRIELIRPAIDAGGFEQTQISQEIQVSTKLMEDRLSLVAGVFGFKEQSKETVFEGVLSSITEDDILDVVPGLGPLTLQAKTDLVQRIRGAQVRSLNRVDNLSYSAYAQVSYAITDRLSLTGGLRLTRDRRRLFREGLALTSGQGTSIPLDGSMAPVPLQAGDRAFFFERSKRFSALTPSASISYQFAPDILGYVSYGTGFQSGGFSGRAFPPLGAREAEFPVSFDPEELTTYELGLKASFADQRIALNASTFYSIYEDVQLVVLPGDPSVTSVPVQLVNAGEAIVSGGEVEITISPIPSLKIRASIGVLNDRYTSFDDPSDPRAKDRRLPFLSSYDTSTSVEYSFDLVRLGSVTAGAGWTTRSRQFLDGLNSDALEAGKRGILGARLSLQLSDGRTEFALFGDNLLDREYLTSGVDFEKTFGTALRFVGPPRTYGVEMRRRF